MPIPLSAVREEELAGLPGADLVVAGIEDLRTGVLTERALLVLVAAPRLLALGLPVPAGPVMGRSYEHALYELLEESDPLDAYSRYNSLLRRMASFAHTAEYLLPTSQA